MNHVKISKGCRLPMRDFARGCNNRGQSRPIMSLIYKTVKTFFERLYLALGLHEIVPWVKNPQPRPFTLHLFLNFCAIFSPNGTSFFNHHDSPSNLAQSRYPRAGPPKIHPKTGIELWVICLDPVSDNSEKCIGSQWSVRVGRDCSRDSGKAEHPESWVWYKSS